MKPLELAGPSSGGTLTTVLAIENARGP
jgi:hypothetical protein